VQELHLDRVGRQQFYHGAHIANLDRDIPGHVEYGYQIKQVWFSRSHDSSPLCLQYITGDEMGKVLVYRRDPNRADHRLTCRAGKWEIYNVTPAISVCTVLHHGPH